MMENYSLSDIATATGANRDGYGFGDGNGAWWIIILFLFMFGMGGNAWGRGVDGASACVTTGQFESANNFRTLDNKLNGINNGLCSLGYEQANLINATTAELQKSITGEGRALQMQIADCCCTTQRAIDNVNFENAKNTQKIIDLLQGNRMAEMQNQINQLQLQSALCGVIRYPNTMSYNAGVSPFCGGCGCGNVNF